MDWIIEAEIVCPWCGEAFPTSIDTSQGDYTAVEDCAVCCRPMEVHVRCEPGELVALEVAR
jgi:hypothetical protein